MKKVYLIAVAFVAVFLSASCSLLPVFKGKSVIVPVGNGDTLQVRYYLVPVTDKPGIGKSSY